MRWLFKISDSRKARFCDGSLYLSDFTQKYSFTNFQRWMSWLAQRWRTQRTAIRSVNCRIQWIIRLLNAKGAVRVSSWRHVCFSVSLLFHKWGRLSFSKLFKALIDWQQAPAKRECAVVDFKAVQRKLLSDSSSSGLIFLDWRLWELKGGFEFRSSFVCP